MNHARDHHRCTHRSCVSAYHDIRIKSPPTLRAKVHAEVFNCSCWDHKRRLNRLTPRLFVDLERSAIWSANDRNAGPDQRSRIRVSNEEALAPRQGQRFERSPIDLILIPDSRGYDHELLRAHNRRQVCRKSYMGTRWVTKLDRSR